MKQTEGFCGWTLSRLVIQNEICFYTVVTSKQSSDFALSSKSYLRKRKFFLQIAYIKPNKCIFYQSIKLKKSCEVVAFISAVNRGGLNGDPMHLSSEGLRDSEGAEGGGTQKMRR